MISFCQDLSISYEYHIYENKTVKKVVHRRNGSNISQKTFVKASKLQVVSRRPQNDFPKNPARGINLTEPSKKIPYDLSNNNLEKRTFSSKLQKNKDLTLSDRNMRVEFHQRNQHNSQFRQVELVQAPQTIIRQQMQYKKSDLLQNQKNLKIYNFFNQTKIKKHKVPIVFGMGNVEQSSSFNRNFQKWSNCQSKTIRIKQSVQRLDQSVQTQNYYKNTQKGNLFGNKSQYNSFILYNSAVKVNNQKTGSTFLQNDKQKGSQKRTQQAKNIKQFQTNLKTTKISNPKQTEISSNIKKESEFYDTTQTYHRIIVPLKLQQDFQQKSTLFNTPSIQSNDLDQQDDDFSLSVVQQRNFYFQKQSYPDSFFKKSIHKYIFFGPGHLSQNHKWIIFKDVQEKDNQKLYSIKQFSVQHQKEYLNQYEIYLALKVQNAKNIHVQKPKQTFVLDLFNALSNYSDRKLHLVKQTFKFVLNEYIDFLKTNNSSQIERKVRLMYEKTRIQSQLNKIFQFFLKKQVQIKIDQVLQVEDFVVCQQKQGAKVIKFHSLYKLEKTYIQPQKISYFAKFNSSGYASHPDSKQRVNQNCKINNQRSENQIVKDDFSFSMRRRQIGQKIEQLVKQIEQSLFCH